MNNGLMDLAAVRRLMEADEAFTEYNTRRALRTEDGQIERRSFGDVIALRDPTVEYPYYNRAVGLEQANLSVLPEVISHYHAVGKACHLTLVQPYVSSPLLDELAERGFVLKGLDCIFATRCTGWRRPSPTVPIRRATREDLETVFDLWEVPFATPVPAEVRRRKADAQLAPEFPIYLAFDGDRPVSMATMFIHGPIAWLGNANTFVEDRCKGAHLALLAHRLNEAVRMGCAWAVTDTEFGTVSHRNVLRAGLEMQFAALDMCLPLPETTP